MKTHSLFLCLAIILGICISSKTNAQERTENKFIPVDISIELKNAHIWRGQDVSHNALIDANLRLMDKSETFAFGIWGATTFTSDFREFDYYAGFYKSGFSLEIWDIFNFSNKNAFDPITNTGYNVDNAFDYAAHTTGHFVDLRLAYQISDKFPLTLKWNTVIFGRDRARISYQDPANSGEYIQKYSKARFSSYVEAEYPVLKSDFIDVNVGVGAAFALRSAKIDGVKYKGNFYGESSGVVNASLALTKRFRITDKYTLPVTATAVWNPEARKTYIEIAAKIAQF